MTKKRRDLTGLVFGRLTVIKLSNRIGNNDEPYWACICSCGIEKEIVGPSLSSGKTKSCGCLVKDEMKKRILPKGECGFNCVLSDYKYNAKKRGLQWYLSKDDFKYLTQQNCYYCGSPPLGISKPNSKRASIDVVENSIYCYNGVDRKDNKLGYIKENVVSCCKQCNIIKMHYSHDDFINKCKLIASRF